MFIDKREFEELKAECKRSKKEYKEAETKCIAYNQALSKALTLGKLDYKTFQFLNELVDDKFDELCELYGL